MDALIVLACIVLACAVLGLIVGSFHNGVAYRAPHADEVLPPPYRCTVCDHPLRLQRALPVLGWLLLRGRCPDCGAPISTRYPLVEAGTAVAFALTGFRFAHEPRLLPAYIAFTALIIVLALVDVYVQRLPDMILLPAYPLLIGLLLIDHDGAGLIRALLGALLMPVIFGFLALVLGGRMTGFGDLKFASLIGGMLAYLSWGAVAAAVILSFVLSSLAAVTLLVTGRAERRAMLAFGPFLALGAYASMLGASALGEAFLRLLGE